MKYQSLNPNISGSTIISLDNILVILICIGYYKRETKNAPLGTHTDKDRYIDDLLNKAKKEFRRKDINYKAVIIVYSRHRDANNLILSDDTTYSRDKFIKYFNGANITPKLRS